MHNFISYFILATGMTISTPLLGDVVNPIQTQSEPAQQNFEPFTGSVKGHRVRQRLSPSLDGPILEEVENGQLFIVTGAVDDFYAVVPQPGTKAYLFRTYVLDGVVEGQNVNVRIAPDLNAHVITQMHGGDKVTGVICEKNNKWLEIAIPEPVRFYIAKEYIEKVGDKNYFNKVEVQHKKLDADLSEVENAINTELKKPFPEIQLAPIAAKLRELASETTSFPKEKTRVDALLKDMQERYLEISLNQQYKAIDFPDTRQEALHPIVVTPAQQNQDPTQQVAQIQPVQTITIPTSSLIQQEKTLVQDAITSKNAQDSADFYRQEMDRSHTIKGILARYERHVKNRPGDYLLLDPVSHVPVAFLYSTTVDLKPYIGKKIDVKATQRPNYNFAFPAYFALEVKVKEIPVK